MNRILLSTNIISGVSAKSEFYVDSSQNNLKPDTKIELIDQRKHYDCQSS